MEAVIAYALIMDPTHKDGLVTAFAQNGDGSLRVVEHYTGRDGAEVVSGIARVLARTGKPGPAEGHDGPHSITLAPGEAGWVRVPKVGEED